MKKKLLLFALFTSLLLNAQNEKEKIGNQICDCFENKKKDTNYSGNVYEDCFNKLGSKINDKLVKKIFDESLINGEELNGYEKGKIANYQIRVYLIKNCQSFFDFIEEKRDTELNKIKDYLTENNINTDDLDSENTSNYSEVIEIGKKHLALNQLSDAESDFKKFIKLNPNSNLGYFFLAWTYEKQKKYSESIKLLKDLTSSINDENINIILEIVKKKLLDQESKNN